jgi:hypothetical protein
MVAGGRGGKDDRKKYMSPVALYLLFCGFDSSMGGKMGGGGCPLCMNNLEFF